MAHLFFRFRLSATISVLILTGQSFNFPLVLISYQLKLIAEVYLQFFDRLLLALFDFSLHGIFDLTKECVLSNF